MRPSKNAFATGYRPTFQIRDDYLTTGEIILINKTWLNFNETAEAFIRFLTPELYPNSLSIGMKILFGEGTTITGEAMIEAIRNPILKIN